MAVIDEIPGLEATVQVGGQAVEEYDDPYPNETENEAQFLAEVKNQNRSVSLNAKHIPIVRKYIEAISGAEFRIKFVKHPDYKHNSHHIAIRFAADRNPTAIIHEPRECREYRWDYTFWGIANQVSPTKYTAQSLTFGNVKTVDTDEFTEEQVRQHIVRAKGLGILKVYVYEMEDTDKTHKPSYNINIYRMDDLEISEKATKGRILTNAVKFGEPKISQKPKDEPESVFTDPEKRPLAIFEFIYMSKEGLIKEGVLPEPLPIDKMDNDELRKWAREQYIKERDRSVKDEKDPKVKKEGDEAPQSGRKRGPEGTEAPLAKRYKESRRSDGRVEIDLED
ncbi:hypothetical protein F4810DRAFT_706687 [Camillea tinctor]|nr:hypothetical protein F4810DRAFT_706687 [Camillea tinctor]